MLRAMNNAIRKGAPVFIPRWNLYASHEGGQPEGVVVPGI